MEYACKMYSKGFKNMIIKSHYTMCGAIIKFFIISVVFFIPNVLFKSFHLVYVFDNFGDMMMSSNGNIFRVTGPNCGEFTGHRWIPLTKPMTRSFDAFFDLRLNRRLNKQS